MILAWHTINRSDDHTDTEAQTAFVRALPNRTQLLIATQAYLCLHMWRDGVPAHLKRVPHARLLRTAHQPCGVALRLRRHCGINRSIILSAGEPLNRLCWAQSL